MDARKQRLNVIVIQDSKNNIYFGTVKQFPAASASASDLTTLNDRLKKALSEVTAYETFNCVINGYYTRIPDYGNDSITSLDICHHSILLNLRPPEDLEDIFHVMVAIYKKEGII
jgi:predicted RNase H-like HicB family nuclease